MHSQNKLTTSTKYSTYESMKKTPNSGENLTTRWHDCGCASYMQLCVLVSNAALQFLAFVSTTMIYFLFLLNKAYRANFSGRPNL